MNEERIIYKDESYAIMGACFEVYKEKGHGFLEAVYQECLEMEFTDRQIPFLPQSALPMSYKGRLLRNRYTPDFVCHGKIIVELKAASTLTDEYRAQVQNYLRTGEFRLGLLINFGHYPMLEWERIAF